MGLEHALTSQWLPLPSYLINMLIDATQYGKPIWVTEYGVTASSGGSQDQIKAFQSVFFHLLVIFYHTDISFSTQATAWMETQSYVQRAAWLG